MAIGGTSNSSMPDFAFAPPTHKTPFQFTNPTPNTYYDNGYSTGNSFSSASSGGASFSSADALPAISRDFARPSPVDTRRPNTAGGALGMRSPQGMRRETSSINEEIFTNPFGMTDNRTVNPESVDPRHIPANRRASEGVHSMGPPPTAWTPDMVNQMPYSAGSAYRTPASASAARPVTSDGLPSFGGVPALPSARSVVGSVDGFTPISGLQPAAQIRASFDDDAQFRDSRFGRFRDEGFTSDLAKQKKRPRRRFDEIERMYECGWEGCEKSYGTLNHLNAHVHSHKHGQKRLPAEFKELRKQYRKRKREQAAAVAHLNSSAGFQDWSRSSMSSDSAYSRRDSFNSNPRYSMDTTYDSRPNTASSISSVGSGYVGGMSAYPYDYSQAQLQQQQANGGPSMNNSNNVRRDSAPQRIPLPLQPMLGFQPNLDGPTPTQQNPFPASASASAPATINGMPNMQMHANRQPQPSTQFQNGFPFQASPNMQAPGQMVQGYQQQQFAFQRSA